MQTIVYTCPFVPAEWIAAHGLQPHRLIPRSAHDRPPLGLVTGLCPYARAFANSVCSELDATAIIVTTVCDQMRRVSEFIARNCDRPVFLMNVPHTWQTSSARGLYVYELERLGRFLQRLGGTKPSDDDLARTMDEYDAARAALRAARARLSPRTYSEAVAQLNRDGPGFRPPVDLVAVNGGVPLALTGGPLMEPDFRLFDIIERAGGRVVLDATETGEISLPRPFGGAKRHTQPLQELADAYFGTIPHAARRPDSLLYDWLGRELLDRGVRGIILRRYVWCDTWHAEVQRLREWTMLPVLDLDVNDDQSTISRMTGRTESFLETLR
jgi:benzoyl-CoA reductase/2-hydroxyglutaryl-CoA dehydratase subunit BcrC/BadD/HgdB